VIQKEISGFFVYMLLEVFVAISVFLMLLPQVINH